MVTRVVPLHRDNGRVTATHSSLARAGHLDNPTTFNVLLCFFLFTRSSKLLHGKHADTSLTQILCRQLFKHHQLEIINVPCYTNNIFYIRYFKEEKQK